MSKFCPICGKTIKDSTNFCPNCGYDFNRDKKRETPDDDGKKSAKGLYFVIIVIVLALFFVACSISHSRMYQYQYRIEMLPE